MGCYAASWIYNPEWVEVTFHLELLTQLNTKHISHGLSNTLHRQSEFPPF